MLLMRGVMASYRLPTIAYRHSIVERRMSQAVMMQDARGTSAQAVLTASGALWFAVACVGQWIFAAYITVQYVAPALRNDFSGWNDVMANGLIRGDVAGNAALVVHLFIALVITVGGTLQLMPAIRNRVPVFHRWTGRLYIAIALVTSIAGLYMVWTRHQVGGVINYLGISVDAALIIVFALMTIQIGR